MIDFLHAIGPGGHVVAVCQPVVQALAATAVMAAADDPGQPRSLTLMAGPIDARLNPTAVNELATGRPIEWFERSLIAKVPARYPGAGRRGSPGFLQLAAFVTMNAKRHADAFAGLFSDLIADKIPLGRRSHHLQAGVGHFGVFSGSHWEREVYPVVRNAILSGERRPRPAAKYPARTDVHARRASQEAPVWADRGGPTAGQRNSPPRARSGSSVLLVRLGAIQSDK